VAGGDLAVATVQRTLAGDRVFVAECDGRRVGYAAVSEAAPALVLDQLVVAATDQGRGVGHALLDWVEGYGVSRGLQTVRVPAAGADQRARDFYLRRGYLDGGSALERELVHA
jgi:GNAT superfamily N-acetyltransferase